MEISQLAALFQNGIKCATNAVSPALDLRLCCAEALSAETALGFFTMPRVAFMLGTMFMSLAGRADTEGQINLAHELIHQAIPYLTRASQMMDLEGDRTPARAMVALAQLYEAGLLSPIKPDFDNSFRLMMKAAQAGLVDGMINLAIMYARGEGAPQSTEDAVGWLILANQANANPVTEFDRRMQAQLGEEIEHIRDEFLQGMIPARRNTFRISPQVASIN